MERLRVAALVLSIAAISSGVAWAQNADAELLFAEGDRAEAAGQIDAACTAFAASNKIEPRAGTLIRLGGCFEKQTKLTSAWGAYKDALARVKDPNKKAIAEARIAELEPRLSKLTIVVPTGSKVPGLVVQRDGVELPDALWDHASPVDGGVHSVEVLAPGHQPWKTTVEVAPEGANEKVEVPVLPKLAPVPTAVEKPVEQPPERSGLSTKRKVAIGVGAAGVVIEVVAVVMGAQSRSARDRAFDLCADPAEPCANATEAQSQLDRAKSRATLANVSFVVGGAALVGAGVLWYVGRDKAENPKRVSVGAHVDATTAALRLSGRF